MSLWLVFVGPRPIPRGFTFTASVWVALLFLSEMSRFDDSWREAVIMSSGYLVACVGELFVYLTEEQQFVTLYLVNRSVFMSCMPFALKMRFLSLRLVKGVLNNGIMQGNLTSFVHRAQSIKEGHFYFICLIYFIFFSIFLFCFVFFCFILLCRFVQQIVGMQRNENS